ncbi:hypothetical protein C8R43DRAFT_943251 [Mycena crocata]|nr:hypothetical protein C8R43DRAFT_943251 [Mycena crocata]
MSTACNSCGNPPFPRSNLLPGTAELEQLRDILRSNTLPLETTESNFRGVIDQASKELARYDDEICRLQRSFFSPIQRLPAEVLVEIYNATSPSWNNIVLDVAPEQDVACLAKKQLLDVAQVCQAWYSIVVGTPALWSTIMMDTRAWGKSTMSTELLLTLIASTLERSTQHPLVICS